MPKRKSLGAGPDRFQVGQTVRLVMGKSSGWAEADGTTAVVVGPKRFGSWSCGPLFNATLPRGTQAGWRYSVSTDWGVFNLCDEHMRPIDGDEEPSTWDAFEKVTGFRLDKPPVTTTKPRRRTARAMQGENHAEG